MALKKESGGEEHEECSVDYKQPRYLVWRENVMFEIVMMIEFNCTQRINIMLLFLRDWYNAKNKGY